MAGRDGALEVMGITDLAKQVGAQYKKYTIPVATKNIIYHFLTRERRKTYGPAHPDQTIYIIRSIADHSPFYIGPVHNLLANYFYVLSHIQYARTKGWIPVVDQLNYPVYNSQSTPIHGTRNPWEYFWQQPGGVSLEEAYQSKNVVLSKQSWFWEWDMAYDVKKYRDKKCVQLFHELSSQAPLNSWTREHVSQIKEKLLPPGQRILGVNVRIGGHDKYAVKHGEGHPIQPQLDALLSIAEQRQKDWNIDAIFLACDTEHVVQAFQSVFSGKLIILPRLRAELGNEYGLDRNKQMFRSEHLFQTSIDYLTEMELLSTCNAFVGSITSGFRYALIRNGNACEHVEVLDCGTFQDCRTREHIT